MARELSLWSLLPLAIAVFSVFSLLGPVVDLLGGGREPVPTIIRGSLLSGLVAVAFVYGMLRR